MRTCVDVVIDDEVGRVEVLDDKVPPLLPSDELAPPRLSEHLGQLPEWKVGVTLLINRLLNLGPRKRIHEVPSC